MRRSLIVAASLLLIGSVPNVVLAQRVSELKEGMRIKTVPLHGKARAGIATSVRRDSVDVLYSDAAQPVPVALKDLSRIDASTGVSHSRGALKGGFLGLGIGLAAGAIVGVALPPDDCFVCSRSLNAVVGGILGGSAGLLIGVVGGASQGSEGWRTVRGARTY